MKEQIIAIVGLKKYGFSMGLVERGDKDYYLFNIVFAILFVGDFRHSETSNFIYFDLVNYVSVTNFSNLIVKYFLISLIGSICQTGNKVMVLVSNSACDSDLLLLVYLRLHL